MAKQSGDSNQQPPDQAAEWDRQERRSHVRVAPAEDAPARLEIEGNEYSVADISLGGLAFTPQDLGESSHLDPGTQTQGRLTLPGAAEPVPVALRVLMIEPWGAVRCAFDQLSDSDSQTLSSYVDQRLADILDKFM